MNTIKPSLILVLKLNLKTASLALLVSSWLMTSPLIAFAQGDYGGGWAVPSLDVATSIGNDIIISEMMARNAGVSPKTGAPARVGTASLTYTPTPALKQQTVQRYVKRLKTSNPAASQAIATNFGSGKYDYGTIYTGVVKEYGIRDNDATEAMVANMVLGYMIVNNLQGNRAVSRSQIAGARAQFGPQLSRNTQLKAPGVAGQLGEEMKLQFVVMQGGWQSAIQENTLPTYQKGVATLFKTRWGLDFTQLALTNQGFIKK